MKSVKDEPAIEYVSAMESDQISRKLLAWLNQYPDFPPGIRRMEFEYLEDDKPCMALSTIQGAYKTVQYISGSYLAQYQFKLIYRAQPQGNDERLSMDEALNALADWAAAREDLPDLGDGLQAETVSSDTRAGLFGRYEGGDEDHQILMTMEYSQRS